MSAVVSGADIVKLEAGAEDLNPASFQAALDFVNKREDPSDFYLIVLMRLYYFNRGKWLKFLPVALEVDSIGKKEKIQ